MKTYTRQYIDESRAKVEADLRAYQRQIGKAISKEFEARFSTTKMAQLCRPRHQASYREICSEAERGDRVKLAEEGFACLYKTFFTELEKNTPKPFFAMCDGKRPQFLDLSLRTELVAFGIERVRIDFGVICTCVC